eukprot:TRINITY_DN57468_c0_g1_i1.p1 TRINITY_DN57468_c0_g1~~TRINITY_DN57468_c0_g1_i1.p1  ORF type:complete len:706 (-),score=114.61 TRINITY_DN57468_c0_g1_i1:69-2186(-)
MPSLIPLQPRLQVRHAWSNSRDFLSSAAIASDCTPSRPRTSNDDLFNFLSKPIVGALLAGLISSELGLSTSSRRSKTTYVERFTRFSAKPKLTMHAQQSINEVGYSPAEVEARALQAPLAVALRMAEVVGKLGQYYLLLKIDDWMERSAADAVSAQSERLRRMLVDLGPCYIKIGQALANRPDILRHDFMTELGELQDKVPAFPTEEALAIMREEFGQDPHDIFSELSPEPVAAASLGQVYRGTLRDTDQHVAVKVQRPGLERALLIDVFIFRKLAQLLNPWAQKNLGCNIAVIVDEFASKLWEEANYRREAQNAQMFEQSFSGDDTVKIPKMFMTYVTRRVLTMEWIDGIKSTDLQGLRRAHVDVDQFIKNGVQAALRQLLEFGLFHGDPHAGNIFALRDGRIAYVDFGNVAYISEQQRIVLIQAITHVSNSDYEEIANDFIRLGFLRPGTDVSEIVPATELIWADSMGKSIRDFNFRTVTSKFSELVYQFPIRVPERFSLVFRALLMQEGICLCLNDQFSIIEVALPYASKRLLSDPNPSMRRELLSVVFRPEVDGGRPVFQWDRLKNLVALAKQARDGSSIQFSEVMVDFFRSLRRDLLDSKGPNLKFPQIVRNGLEALVAGDRLRIQEVLQLIELVSPDLTPKLAAEVADALIRDSVEDVFKAKGLTLTAEDLRDPRRLGQVLSRGDELWKLLPMPFPVNS